MACIQHKSFNKFRKQLQLYETFQDWMYWRKLSEYKPDTLKPKPDTLRLNPDFLKPMYETLKPKPDTLKLKPDTLESTSMPSLLFYLPLKIVNFLISALLFLKFSLVFPVSGLKSSDIFSKDSLKSPLKILNFVMIIFNVLETIFYLYFWIEYGAGINKGFMAALLVQNIILSVKLSILAKQWPALSHRWNTQEAIFRSAPYKSPKLNYRVVIFQYIFLGLIIGTGDQILYFGRKYEQALINKNLCNVPDPLVEHMYWRERYHILYFIGFKYWMVPFFELQYQVLTFNWTCTIFLIIVLSVWLTARLQQLEHRILGALSNGACEEWLEINEHFNRLTKLINEVDEKIGLLILLASFHCFTYLCFYVFKLTR